MDPDLVKKFFDGKCSSEEVHRVLLWINSEEGEKQLEEDFDSFDGVDAVPEKNSQVALSAIHERIANLEEGSSSEDIDNVRSLPKRAKPTRKLTKKWKLGVAASLLLTVLTSTLWLYARRVEEKLPALDKAPQVEYMTKRTKAGEKLTLKLADGSIIRMNSMSMLRFPRQFSAESREVYMEGQVFFDVHRDETKPFIVHSKDLVTRVLGTSFAITDEVDSPFSQVAVLTGEVKVSKSTQVKNEESVEIFLKPMDAASFNATQRSLKKTKVNYEDTFAWKDNVLVFHNASFGEVLSKLENWYGVSIQVKSDFKGQQDYSGRFENQTLEDVLIGLSFTYDFDFDIKKSTIIIN